MFTRRHVSVHEEPYRSRRKRARRLRGERQQVSPCGRPTRRDPTLSPPHRAPQTEPEANLLVVRIRRLFAHFFLTVIREGTAPTRPGRSKTSPETSPLLTPRSAPHSAPFRQNSLAILGGAPERSSLAPLLHALCSSRPDPGCPRVWDRFLLLLLGGDHSSVGFPLLEAGSWRWR